MTYFAYAAAAVLGLWFSYMGLVFAMVGGSQAAYIVGALLLLAYAGVIFYVIRKVKAGKGTPSAFVLVLPAFLVIGVLQVVQIGIYAFSLLTPDAEPFIAECKTMGAQFTKRPVSPVRSIAYDWDTKHSPPFNRFEVKFGTRVTSLGRSDFPHPSSIEFVERKRSSLEGRPAQGPDGPYIRFPRDGAYYAIPIVDPDFQTIN